jgi:hypothetical protein
VANRTYDGTYLRLARRSRCRAFRTAVGQDLPEYATERGDELVGGELCEVARLVSSFQPSRVLLTGHAVTIISRLLAATLSGTVVNDAYTFMREARTVTLRWLREMKAAFNEASEKDRSIEQQILICEMAALVRQTYDVDLQHVDHILSSSEDASILLEAAMTLRENQPSSLAEAPGSLRLLLNRDQRLSHKLEDKLRERISNDWSMLDTALQVVWPDYRSGEMGETRPDSSWISTRTAASDVRAAQDVHLHLLDGTLLVDGKPLGRLPIEIVTHPTYLRTFGQVRIFPCLLSVTFADGNNL